jgi:hypothetical protein
VNLTKADSRWICQCSYDEREIPKEAGFVWGGVWWTDHIEVAKRLIQYAEGMTLLELTASVEKPVPVLKPEGATGSMVADIRLSVVAGCDWLDVHYPDRDENLRRILKGRGFSWSASRCWTRRLGLLQGDGNDRAAEIAQVLMAARFMVRVHGDKAREKAISGDFEPEVTRWVCVDDSKAKGDFQLCWQYGDDMYAAAKALPGAHYMKPHVYVPGEAHAEVLDFAREYEFGVTAGAQALADRVRAQILEAVTVRLKAPSVPKAAGAPGRKPARMEAPAGESIDADLLDG